MMGMPTPPAIAAATPPTAAYVNTLDQLTERPRLLSSCPTDARGMMRKVVSFSPLITSASELEEMTVPTTCSGAPRAEIRTRSPGAIDGWAAARVSGTTALRDPTDPVAQNQNSQLKIFPGHLRQLTSVTRPVTPANPRGRLTKP